MYLVYWSSYAVYTSIHTLFIGIKYRAKLSFSNYVIPIDNRSFSNSPSHQPTDSCSHPNNSPCVETHVSLTRHATKQKKIWNSRLVARSARGAGPPKEPYIRQKSLSTFLPLYLYTSLPLHRSTSLPLYRSTSLPLYLSASPSRYLSSRLSAPSPPMPYTLHPRPPCILHPAPLTCEADPNRRTKQRPSIRSSEPTSLIKRPFTR